MWPAAVSLFPCLLCYLGHRFSVALLHSEAAPLLRPSGWVPPGPKAYENTLPGHRPLPQIESSPRLTPVLISNSHLLEQRKKPFGNEYIK